MEMPKTQLIKIVPEDGWYVLRVIEDNEELCRGKNLQNIFNLASKMVASEVFLREAKLIGMAGAFGVDLDLVRDELKALVAVKKIDMGVEHGAG